MQTAVTLICQVDYFPDWPFSETIPVSYFDEPGVAGFKVRGEDYLQDKKKARCLPSLPALSSLRH